MGFVIVPIVGTSLAFAVELTYPVPEGISNGMMILPSKIHGALTGLLASYLCNFSPLYAISLFIFNSGVATICSLFIKEDLRRLNPSK